LTLARNDLQITVSSTEISIKHDRKHTGYHNISLDLYKFGFNNIIYTCTMYITHVRSRVVHRNGEDGDTAVIPW